MQGHRGINALSIHLRGHKDTLRMRDTHPLVQQSSQTIGTFSHRCTIGSGLWQGKRKACYGSVKTVQQLCPPNPNALLMAADMMRSRA